MYVGFNDEAVAHLLFECFKHERDRCDLELAIGKKLTENNIVNIIAHKDGIAWR